MTYIQKIKCLFRQVNNLLNFNPSLSFDAPTRMLTAIFANGRQDSVLIDITGGAGASPTGLEAIDEGNGFGWRLIGRDPNFYGNIGLDAIDFSEASTSYLPQVGSVGPGSVTFGTSNANRGANGFMNGFNNEITADGFSWSSFVNGANNLADGSLGSATIGTSLINRNAWGCTVLGVANEEIAGGGGALNPGGTAPLLIVGNGTQINNFVGGNFVGYAANVRSNALEVYRSGEIKAPSVTVAEIDAEVTGKILVTKEWVQANPGGGAIQSLTYNFTPAEILALKTSPVTIVPAPGAGKMIRLISAVMRNTVNTTTYNNGEPFVLTISGANDVSAEDTTNIVDGHFGVIQNLYIDPNPLLNYVENAALVATLKSGFGLDATQGDDQIDLYITYEIITL